MILVNEEASPPIIKTSHFLGATKSFHLPTIYIHLNTEHFISIKNLFIS